MRAATRPSLQLSALSFMIPTGRSHLPGNSSIKSGILLLALRFKSHRASLQRVQQVAEVQLSELADPFVGHQAATGAPDGGVERAGDSAVFSSSPVSAEMICTTTAVTLSRPPR